MNLENSKRKENVFTERFCRFCFMDNDLLINFSEKVANDGLMLSDVLVKYLGIVLTEEELPRLVCSDCLEDVLQFPGIRPDIKETVNYIICHGKYRSQMLSTTDQGALGYLQPIRQGIGKQPVYHSEDNHSSTFNNCSYVDTNEHKGGYPDLGEGSLNHTINGNIKNISESSKCWKEISENKDFYCCKKCGDQFLDVDGLNRHIYIFHSKCNKYACGRCEKWFRSKKSLVKHIKKYDFQCVSKRCRNGELIEVNEEENAQSFKKLNAIEPIREESDILKSNILLTECKLSDASNDENEDEKFICSRCGASFVCKLSLKEHIVKSGCFQNKDLDDFHRTSPSSMLGCAGLVPTNLKNLVPKRIYTCDVCKEFFTYRIHVIRHIKEKHNSTMPHMCNICDTGFCSKLDLGLHQPLHKGEKPFTCKTCGANIGVKYFFKMHVMKCQRKNASLKCNVCNKYSSTAHDLKVHSLTHTSERNFQCQYCPDRLKSKGTLRLHVRAKHLKIKPYECKICQRKFTLTSAMYSHQRCHSDERPFTCEECSRSFKLKRTLVKHRKVCILKLTNLLKLQTHLSKNKIACNAQI